MNKKIIIGISAGIIILVVGIVALKFNNSQGITNHIDEVEESTYGEGTEDILKFIEALTGLKANNIEVIDNPIGFKGEFFAPDEAIVNGINYFLEETNNDKMENLRIKSEKDVISINVDYKVTNTIKTPMEFKIKPTINEDKDLVINIDEVRFLDLKIADWIVNIALDNFVEDWFPDNSKLNVDLNKGTVIIYKDNFKGIEINNISLENGLEIQVLMDLEEILN